MRLISVFAILVLFFNFFACSKQKTNIFTEARFQQGKPKLLPEKAKKRMNISYYAEIESGNIFGHVYLVNIGDSLKRENLWIIYSFDSTLSSFSYAKAAFKKDSANNYIGKYQFWTDKEDLISPLKVVYDSNGIVKYKWESDNLLPKIIQEYAYKVGKKLPDITLENDSGKTSLHNFLGKVVVINWWSTTCAPCIMEIPGLNMLHEEYKDVEFISIIYDKENLSSFLEKHPFYYTHYFATEEITKLFNASFPRNIVLDKNGTIVYNKSGGYKDIYKEIENVIVSISKNDRNAN